jgi:lipooligosaccharide transport system permease protein
VKPPEGIQKRSHSRRQRAKIDEYDDYVFLVLHFPRFDKATGRLQAAELNVFIAPGMIASSSMFAAVYECTYGTFVRMTYQKTFDAILATPINIYDLVAGELMWGAAKSVIYGTIIMIVISALGLVNSAAIIAVLPVLFISGLIFAEISMIFVAIVPGIDSFNYFYTLFMTPMFLFSGIFFPLDNLPPLVTKIAFFTPLYHLVNICRSFAGGHIVGSHWNILWMVAVALVLAPYPFRLMKKRIVK